MKNSFFFWAQDLNNTRPDTILYNGDLLDPVKDRQKRQDLVVKLSEITANKQAIQVADNVTVFVQNSEFSLKVIPLETYDESGRLAPVLCFGNIPQQDAEVGEFYQLLRSFLKRTGRDYDDKQLEEDVNRAFELVKKKQPARLSRRTKQVILIIILLIALSILAYLIINLTKSPAVVLPAVLSSE